MSVIEKEKLVEWLQQATEEQTTPFPEGITSSRVTDYSVLTRPSETSGVLEYLVVQVSPRAKVTVEQFVSIADGELFIDTPGISVWADDTLTLAEAKELTTALTAATSLLESL